MNRNSENNRENNTYGVENTQPKILHGKFVAEENNHQVKEIYCQESNEYGQRPHHLSIILPCNLHGEKMRGTVLV